MDWGRLLNWIDERIEARLRRSGITSTGVGGGSIVGPIPAPSLPSHNHTATAGDGGNLTGAVVNSYVQFEAIATPTTPGADLIRIYNKLVGGKGRPHFIDEDGVEQQLGVAAGSGQIVTINYVIDGGGDAPSTGSKGYLVVDFAGTITAATLLADQTGSVVIDVKKSTYTGFPTTASICASAKPTLSSAQKARDTTLTGWTTAIVAGDVLEFVVDSSLTLSRVTLALTVTRS